MLTFHAANIQTRILIKQIFIQQNNTEINLNIRRLMLYILNTDT